MRTLSLILLLALFFTACDDGSSNADNTEEVMEEEQSSDAMAANENYQYTLTPFEESTAYPNATIESMNYQNGQFDFELANYELGVQTPDAGQKMCANSAKGQHIHLIIDNEPYTAHYEPDFQYEMEDGDHYLVAFLSRSYHQSIKTPEAHVAKMVTIENNSITNSQDLTQPMLIYSRPKGTYVGESETQKVMLDFYLLNTTLGDQYQVKADINGEEHMIDEWQPYYIEGLPMGENTIELTLVDSEGNTVDAPLNPVSRTFTLQEDPAEQTQ